MNGVVVSRPGVELPRRYRGVDLKVLTEEEARRQAMVELGGIERTKEPWS